MKEYFDNFKTVSSELEDATVSGGYVTVRERVRWIRSGEEKSQSSLSVYRISDGLIMNVWYFPVD